MTASAYVNILLDVVATLQDTVGVGGTVRALRLGHAMAPEGVTEYDASLRIAELTNSARVATERGVQVLAVSATENGLALSSAAQAGAPTSSLHILQCGADYPDSWHTNRSCGSDPLVHTTRENRNPDRGRRCNRQHHERSGLSIQSQRQ